jgi:hypothetical protein
MVKLLAYGYAVDVTLMPVKAGARVLAGGDLT